MFATPQIVPVSELRNSYNDVLERSEQAPVFLTKNGHAAGVLVSTKAWDRIFARLEDLQDIVDVLEAELAVARGEDAFVATSEEALKLMAGTDAVPS